MTQDPYVKVRNTVTELVNVAPPALAADGQVMTIRVEYPPGDPGIPPHRHPGGPCFGYIVSGEMVFELQGEAPRVVRAGEAFWEPGGDAVHYQDANNRTDMPLVFIVTMIMSPGQEMLVFLDDDELQRSGWKRQAAAREEV